mmetsp:Transcript_59110/g.155675  ORF Transcript_59110/g.155675 Transcript_59110/m.155675 type:complete len:384 (+) Transcript_59110:97-1248(+)
MNIADKDAKTGLNQFCQRYCSRPVTKTDIIYTTTKFGDNQFQAIVKLNCFEGQEYAGELAANTKEAEKSAAQQALQAYANVIASLPASGSAPKKTSAPLGPGSLAGRGAGQFGAPGGPAGRNLGAVGQNAPHAVGGPLVGAPGSAPPAGGAAKASAPGSKEGNPALTDKVVLNGACMKIAKRALQKGETIYETVQLGIGQTPAGFTSTVQLKCLPGAWADKVFAGQIYANKHGAEQSAATAALAAIMKDEELSALAAKATAGPSSSKSGRAGGKGKKKGEGKDGENAGGWSFIPSGPDLPREPLPEGQSDSMVKGEVVQWKGSHGWVSPTEPVKHDLATRRGGKVYVAKQDLVGCDALEEGTSVQFKLYVDASGIGAEEVTKL